MRYLRIFAATRRSRLEPGATRGSVARDCREAALAFLEGVGRGWDKRDLALWLIGPYAYATRHVAHGERISQPPGPSSPPSTMEARIDVIQRLDELMMETRTELLRSLRYAATSDGLDFANDLFDQGFVRPTEDASGTEIWVPVNSARMRLYDRVASLLLADYLNDPLPYGAVDVCGACERVSFHDGAHDSCECPHELIVVARAS